jgi:acyl-CoA thioester hydrolase
MDKPYFKKENSQPNSLHCRVKRTVRFEEVDPLQVVWHGRYASYFEDARVALGEKYGIGYQTLFSNQILTPIKTLHVDYRLPLQFQEECTIEAILQWSEAARINIEYIIRNSANAITATGYTIQMMLDIDFNLYIFHPPLFKDFCTRWKGGEFE